jgi:hypothetical protein
MKEPDEPGGPNHEWFCRGTIDRRKFSEYLFVARHPFNRGKAEGFRRVFGLGPGDEELVCDGIGYNASGSGQNWQ